MQPLLVSISALTLATETVRSILKIDDVVRLNILNCGFSLCIHVFAKSGCVVIHVSEV